ncbi:MAG: phage holin family protein [Patescibacteria group bacterium]
MKYLLKVLFFHSFALWAVSQVIPALTIASGWQPLLFAGGILTLLTLLVTPLLKILFIPINILTFGLLSWVIHVIVLYMLTIFVPSVGVAPWHYQGATFAGFVIPAISFSYTISLIIVSLAVTFVVNLLYDISQH